MWGQPCQDAPHPSHHASIESIQGRPDPKEAKRTACLAAAAELHFLASRRGERGDPGPFGAHNRLDARSAQGPHGAYVTADSTAKIEGFGAESQVWTSERDVRLKPAIVRLIWSWRQKPKLGS